MAGLYFSPNRTLVEFDTFLDAVGTEVRRSWPRRVLLMGDLNAKSAIWGSPVTDARGTMLGDWAVLLDLTVLNRGSELTCGRRGIPL